MKKKKVKKEKIIYTVDIIAKYKNKFVMINRLNFPKGIALPGGKHEKGENLSETAIREFKEETGLKLTITSVLGTYAKKGRDPRGNYVTTVFVGKATGRIKDEAGMTHVTLLTLNEVKAVKKFSFDHGKIFKDYLKTIE